VVERAQLAYVDLRGRHAGACELIARCAPEIEVWFRVRGKPRGCVGVRRELRDELGANLVAAWSDARANRCDHVFGLRRIFLRHRVDSNRRCASDRALPSSMNGGNDPGSSICKKNGHAVGNADA
jgi:hypothetical protein